jgi:hypothetical protein
MLYLWRHNVFRVESCSCIEKSGKLDVSREQDVTRTHVVRVVCCLSLTGYQSLQYVSLRLRTFFVFRKSCEHCKARFKNSLASRLWRKGMIYEENCDCDDIAVVRIFICGTMLLSNSAY